MRPKLKAVLATTLILAAIVSAGLLWQGSKSPQPRARADLTIRAIKFDPPPMFPGVTLPEQLYSCVDSGLAGIDLWGQTKDRGKQFYLLGLYRSYSRLTNPLTPVTVQEGLIQQSKADCQRLVGVDSVQKSLTAYVSKTAASDLERQRFAHFAALLGGSQQLSRALMTYRKDYRLSAEAVTALSQMGIKVTDYAQLQPNTFESN